MTIKIQKWIDQPNIADDLPGEVLSRLGGKVVDDYGTDLQSRSDWEQRTKSAIDLAMQVMEAKSWPWPNAANVKYPLIAEAAIQFHARAYPEIIRGNDVVKGKVIGRDDTGEKEERADRISKHMSYQVLEEMVEWEEETDRLLIMLPVIGTLFRKTYFCPIRQRNVSSLRKPLDIVVHNEAKSIEDARRVTDHGIHLYRNDIIERQQAGVFSDVDISYEHDEEKQLPEQFLEQHRWEDMDGDGYEEPYIVTVHKHSRQVVRVVARYDGDGVYVQGGKILRIEPVEYFTKYSFLPSFDGSFYDLGFGQLLLPINEAINTNLNQLMDAGTLANVQGGLLSKGIKIKGGQYRFAPGEWKITDASPQDLANGVMPMPTKEPSAVLYNLLLFLIDTGKSLASVSDVMTGEQTSKNEPAERYLARLEQGMKVFSGIHKRIYRALKAEYKKIARLNRKYLEDEYYYRVLDTPQVIARADYEDKNVDVVPVADPTQGTDIQRMAKAQALLAMTGRPGINAWEIDRRYLQALNVSSIDEIQPNGGREKALAVLNAETPPDPKVMELQMKLGIEQEKLRQAAEESSAKVELINAQIELTRAQGIKYLADAEAAQLGPQLEYYKQFADRLNADNIAMREMMEGAEAPEMEIDDDERRVRGMEGTAIDGAGVQLPAGSPEGAGTEVNSLPVDGADFPGDGAEGGGFAGA